MDRAERPITILAIHGNGGGAFRFSLVPELATPLMLEALTLPGFQGRRLPSGTVTLSTFREAVVAAITDIGEERPDDAVVVLGHGIGGSIALDTVANEPGVADGLILVSPVGVKLDERWFPKLMSAPLVRRVAKAAISSRLTQHTAGRFLFPRAPRAYAKRFLAEYANADAFDVMFDLLNAEWFEALPPPQIPVALVWGAKDRVLDVSHVEAYEAAIADTRRVVLDDWGHYPMIEQPADFARTITEIAVDLVAP